MQADRSILYLVTEDWYFCLHRLPIARAARDAGYHVYVATRVHEHAAVLEREGFEVLPLDWRRESRNPLRALVEIARIIRLYRRYRPDIVHHVALKPACTAVLPPGFPCAPRSSITSPVSVGDSVAVAWRAVQ